MSTKARDLLRVGTYNIAAGKGRDGKRDLMRAAETLNGADLVGLQEVCGPSHLERLARRTSLCPLYLPAETRWFREHRGNGLLTNVEVADWEVEPLPVTRSKGFRSLAQVNLTTHDRSLMCFVAHCSKHEDRESHLEVVLNKFLACDRAILMGDLNTNRFMEPLATALSDTSIDAIGTALGERDDPGRIDWILVKGLKVVDGGVNDSPYSDHPYYWVDLTFG